MVQIICKQLLVLDNNEYYIWIVYTYLLLDVSATRYIYIWHFQLTIFMMLTDGLLLALDPGSEFMEMFIIIPLILLLGFLS